MPDPATPSIRDGYAPSALPSAGARVVAFVSILVGGLAGGLIGWSLVDLQCTGDCGVVAGVAAVIGALIGSIGVAVVATLALRAMGEWRTVQHRQEPHGRSNHAQHPTEPGPPRC